jgi:hypothetical protein
LRRRRHPGPGGTRQTGGVRCYARCASSRACSPEPRRRRCRCAAERPVREPRLVPGIPAPMTTLQRGTITWSVLVVVAKLVLEKEQSQCRRSGHLFKKCSEMQGLRGEGEPQRLTFQGDFTVKEPGSFISLVFRGRNRALSNMPENSGARPIFSRRQIAIFVTV